MLKSLAWVRGVERDNTALWARVGENGCTDINLRAENFGDHGLLLIDIYINGEHDITLVVKNGVESYGFS